MDSELELRRYLAIFLRWAWLIAICAVLGAVSAYVVSSRQPPVYRAAATLLVRPAPSTQMSEYSALIAGERLAQTYVQMVSSRSVLEEAADRLGMEGVPGVSAEVVQDTQMMRLSVQTSDPVQAALVVNTVAEVFIDQNQQMQQQRYADSLASVRQQMEELSTLMSETQTAIDLAGTPSTSQEQAELSRLETTLAQYRNTYASLLQSYEQMRLTAAQSADDVMIFEEAQVPGGPVGPQTMRNTALAGVTGAMIAVGVAFLIEYLDDTVKTPDDVRQATGLGTLGAIGRLDKEDPELVTTVDPLSPVSESFRKLRTNIRFSGVDHPLRTIVVTSPRQSEGKSITVANLAVAMAQAGLRVTLVDADLRRPRIHKLFAVHTRGGLTGSLVAGALNGRVQEGEVEGLSLLPAGELPPNPAELLGSQRMGELLEHLSAEADVVLVDSPPVLPVADTVVLGAQVDGVILVIDVGQTRRGFAQQAVENLRQVDANVIGVVLNRVPTSGGYYYYYYRDDDYTNGNGKKRRRWQLGFDEPLAAVRRLVRRVKR